MMKQKLSDYLKLNHLDKITTWYIEDVVSDERLRDIACEFRNNIKPSKNEFLAYMKNEILKFYPVMLSDHNLYKMGILDISARIFVADYLQINLNNFFDESGKINIAKQNTNKKYEP